MKALLPEEELFISSSTRCLVCNHLEAFHNYHCCAFCLVPDCLCDEPSFTPNAEDEK
jgi:hypothetical protein